MITHEKIKELADQNPDHAASLKALFPEVFPEEKYFDFSKMKSAFLRHEELPSGFEATGLQVRVFGTLAHKGFYLGRGYNWEIIKDNEDELVLVPTRKHG